MVLNEETTDCYSGLLTYNHDPEDTKRYNAHYSKLDPRAGKSATLALHETVTGQQLVPNELFRHTEYYAAITVQADVMDSVHGVIADDREMGRCAISIQRGFGADFFDDEAQSRLAWVLPHLDLGMRNSLRMSHIYAQGLSEEPLVYGLIDRGLNLHFFEGTALDLANILDIDPIRQKLCFHEPALAQSVSRAVGKAAAGRQIHLLLTDCQITLSSPPPGLDWLSFQPCAFIVLAKRVGLPEVAVFADAFALTRREREILERLILDQDRDLACQKLGISAETLRWHIRNLLSKTRHPNMASLLAAVRLGDLSNIF